ncbi:MAG: carboxymuconolactone decarboxylase family protein [Nitrospirae bacterium]|nr:carboxymuconolactone decarboxylase family protein [Nitrospirota bacterium]
MAALPSRYQKLKDKHGAFINAVEQLGTVVKNEGPLDNKTALLIQLAGAAAIRSEGSVHSHVKRALEAGATKEEISHAVILLASVMGFPQVAAALSWIEDVFETQQGE